MLYINRARTVLCTLVSVALLTLLISVCGCTKPKTEPKKSPKILSEEKRGIIDAYVGKIGISPLKDVGHYNIVVSLFVKNNSSDTIFFPTRTIGSIKKDLKTDVTFSGILMGKKISFDFIKNSRQKYFLPGGRDRIYLSCENFNAINDTLQRLDFVNSDSLVHMKLMYTYNGNEPRHCRAIHFHKTHKTCVQVNPYDRKPFDMSLGIFMVPIGHEVDY